MHFSRSLTTRMVFSHIMTAIITSLFVILALAFVLQLVLQNVPASEYRTFAVNATARWLFNQSMTSPSIGGTPVLTPGYSLIVNRENEVVYTEHDAPCTVGQELADCAPSFVDATAGERFFFRDDEQWAQVVMDIATGHRVIVERGLIVVNATFTLGGLQVSGFAQTTMLLVGIVTLLSVPVALVLGWLFASPMTRRLSKVAQVSQQISMGDFSARVCDYRQDEVGKLANQLDDMASVLENNIIMLRELAQRNAALVQHAEQAAVQNERMRLSRDLHDAIAQRLFSLTASTTSLPKLIQQDPLNGAEQAKVIAALAENTLLDLRTLLVELRPTHLLRYDLIDALQKLSEEWNSVHHTSVECSLVMPSGRVSTVLEDVIYRVTEESLNNIAKHACAKHVTITVVQGKQYVTLSITDDGIGFDSAALPQWGKFGLAGMRERVQAVGGRFSIESRKGSTTIQAVLPYEREA